MFANERHPDNPYRLTEEWGKWLSKFPWSHWETLTFENQRYSARACFSAVAAYHRRLQRAGIKSRRFVVVEGDARTRLHVHTLAMLSWDRTVVPARAALSDGRALHRAAFPHWKDNFGRAQISPLGSDSVGASIYVGKYVSKHAGSEWRFLPDDGWEPYLPS